MCTFSCVIILLCVFSLFISYVHQILMFVNFSSSFFSSPNSPFVTTHTHANFHSYDLYPQTHTHQSHLYHQFFFRNGNFYFHTHTITFICYHHAHTQTHKHHFFAPHHHQPLILFWFFFAESSFKSSKDAGLNQRRTRYRNSWNFSSFYIFF